MTGLGRRDSNPPTYRTGRDYARTNDTTTTLTLSTGAGWTTADTITITATADFFLATEVGNVKDEWLAATLAKAGLPV